MIDIVVLGREDEIREGKVIERKQKIKDIDIDECEKIMERLERMRFEKG